MKQRGRRAAPSQLDALRRKVYVDLPAAGWNLITQVDPDAPYAETARRFAAHDAGVDSRGAALALCRLYRESGYRSICYACGFPDVYSHTVTLVADGERIYAHDAFLNLRFADDLDSLLAILAKGKAPRIDHESSTPKRVVVDPDAERPQVLSHLRKRAAGKQRKVGSLYVFQVPWGVRDLRALSPGFSEAEGVAGGRARDDFLATFLPHAIG
ncbi:MAG: hypothetical protein QOD74_2770, partial [Variibacter sp.]|nr:hypothetical protein [Variibacter sp.]